MNKILVICGPTATGKTTLARELAKIFNGQLISVDSRQAYRYLDIGTGKDKLPGETILGYDLFDPQEKMNVSSYIHAVIPLIAETIKEGKLPILVGGGGLYIKALIDGIETVDIPQNPELRKELASKNRVELLEMLQKESPEKAARLNVSDSKNPRRLVRAIEIAKSPKELATTPPIYDPLFIGLTLPIEKLKEKITKRVEDRVTSGIKQEIEMLIGKGVAWNDQSLESLGYREWQGYFAGQKKEAEVLEVWIHDELQYAKRQLTWFKKDQRIKWFNADDVNLSNRVAQQVKKWYNTHI